MLDDFFIRAILAGAGMAIVAGPMGCVIVWRRLSYFGDTLAHSALLGVAIGFIFQIDITLAVLANSIVIGGMLLFLQRQSTIPPDALLGLLSHGALALGLVALAAASQVRIDLMALLFGDILAVSRGDLAIIYGGSAVVLTILAMVWTGLFAATVSEEIAAAEGLAPARTRLVFVLLLASVVAIAMKLVGIMLITALLIIPAATARQFASGPEKMAAIAILTGIASVVAGLSGSLRLDTPAGPSIVVAATALFAASMVTAGIRAGLAMREGRNRP